ncbi:DUF3048 domain-containing protein [Prauserella muralis]|uniref:DUF3048 domain-containing protein n=1 Tax=Prauserella muralis TaxID=588067 RepID=UPI0011ADDCB1|nr:DUF3048 domain-containing protein [Prauserella muralis]TWE27908.1 DUF3048 family protein [Prauserella muralis]
MATRRVRLALVAGTVLAVVAVLVAVLLLFGEDDSPRTPPAAPRGRAALGLAVKIDNVDLARPQTGLASADVVYVEPVEGGLTRLVAVYSAPPAVAGPVRSARETDVELLAQYGRPALAFSGEAPQLRGLLDRSPLVLASPQEAPSAYFRDAARGAPHNLYVRPGRLPRGEGKPVSDVLAFGPAPARGTPRDSYEVRYPAAAVRFDWDGARWTVTMNGTPLRSTESGRLTAASVVVQRVAVRPGRVTDAAGSASPVARTVGSGQAVVLRDGTLYPARWSRPRPADGTRFTTGSGASLPLAGGVVWVLLVPGR